MSADEIRKQYEAVADQYGDLQSWTAIDGSGEGDSKKPEYAWIRIDYSLTWKNGATTTGNVVLVGETSAFFIGDVDPKIRSFSLK